MEIDDKKISLAISKFESNNTLSVKDYRHRDEIYIPGDNRGIDNLIAESVFCNRILDWLALCNDEESVNEFLLLLSNYTYFSETRYYNEFSNIVNQIITDVGIDLSKVLFVTTASKNHCSSGGDNVRAMLTTYARGMMSRKNIICYKNERIYNHVDYELVVFVDDIIGSGCTMYNMVDAFFTKNVWLRSKKVYIACLCGREKKVKDKVKKFNKRGLNIDYRIMHPQKKCYDQLRVSNNKELILGYEKNINSTDNILENDSEKECIMGFEHNQMLVSFYYETPNNTLSVFWRKTKISPNPLFIRLPKSKPNVSWFSKRRDDVKAFAYNLFRMKK